MTVHRKMGFAGLSGFFVLGNGMKIELLDKIIAFHACFVKPLGSVNAALMFSQIIYWSNRTTNADGWFYKTAEEFEDETGLTRKEQANARMAILAQGWTEEKLCGIPATVNFRLSNKFYQFVQSSFTQSGKLDFPKAENLFRLSGETNSESTTKTTTDNTPIPPTSATPPCVPVVKTCKKKNTSRVSENTTTMIRIGSWFRREPTTRWSVDEARRLEGVNPSEEELLMMEKFYTAPKGETTQYRRHDVVTLLNNWTGELDRARTFLMPQFDLRNPATAVSKLSPSELSLLANCRNDVATDKAKIESGNGTIEEKDMYDRKLKKISELEAKAATP